MSEWVPSVIEIQVCLVLRHKAHWHAAVDAQGAQRLGLVSSLLARLEATGVGIGRPDGAALDVATSLVVNIAVDYYVLTPLLGVTSLILIINVSILRV
jgi:hypothetical protein